MNEKTVDCTIILDLDGTIIPMLVDFEKVRSEVRKILNINHPLRPLGESLVKLEIDEDLRRKAWSIVEKAELESIEKLDVKIVEENTRAIKKTAERGVKLVLVTMRSIDTVIPILEKLGLVNVFKDIVTRTLLPGRRRQLEHILESSNTEKSIFIGDTEEDEQVAADLGVEFIRVHDYIDLPNALDRAVKSCFS